MAGARRLESPAPLARRAPERGPQTPGAEPRTEAPGAGEQARARVAAPLGLAVRSAGTSAPVPTPPMTSPQLAPPARSGGRTGVRCGRIPGWLRAEVAGTRARGSRACGARRVKRFQPSQDRWHGHALSSLLLHRVGSVSPSLLQTAGVAAGRPRLALGPLPCLNSDSFTKQWVIPQTQGPRKEREENRARGMPVRMQWPALLGPGLSPLLVPKFRWESSQRRNTGAAHPNSTLSPQLGEAGALQPSPSFTLTLGTAPPPPAGREQREANMHEVGVVTCRDSCLFFGRDDSASVPSLISHIQSCSLSFLTLLQVHTLTHIFTHTHTHSAS